MKTVLVSLYTHRGCPGGDAARRYLEEHAIPYQSHDVLQDRAAQAEFHRIGGIGTPLVQIGTRIMQGFDPEEFEQLRALAEGRSDRG